MEFNAIFYIAKLLLWLVTGFEAISAHLIGLERLHRWAILLSRRAKSYHRWRQERKLFHRKVSAHPAAISKHYEQLALDIDHEKATELRQLGERLALEEGKAAEIDRLNSLSLGTPGDQLPNPHYDNAQSLEEKRRALAIALNAPEPRPPKEPPLPMLAFAELGLTIPTWILSSYWLFSLYRKQTPTTFVILSDALSPLAHAHISALTFVLSILTTAILGGVAIIITKTVRAAIALSLFAATYLAGWSLRKPVLNIVFTTGFILAFALETYEQAPRVTCMIKAFFGSHSTLALEACIASAKS